MPLRDTVQLASIGWLTALALLFMPLPASALHWNASELLSATSPGTVRLTERNGAERTYVTTIDRAWVARAQGVVQRLAPEYGLAVPTLLLMHDKQPNAFVTLSDDKQPVLVINTEMLRMVGDDDNLTAAVIGHELGHLKGNHLTDGAFKQSLTNFLGVLAGLALDISQARRGVDTGGFGIQLGDAGSSLVNAKFSRDQEREADELGIRAMARAGYDPRAVPKLWRTMEGRGEGSDGLWMSSHPSHEERVRSMQSLAVALAAPSPVPAPTLYANLPPSVKDSYPSTRLNSLGLTPEEVTATMPSAYRRAFEAQRAGRLEEAVVAYDESVQLDQDERAMTMLGDAYLLGRGVAKDEAKAYGHYLQAANKGFPLGMFMLGDVAQRGVGRNVDMDEAARMFALARQRGVPRASARLAFMYMNGTGVPKDVVRARSLAQEANDRNDALGKAALGAMLRDGLGGPVDAKRGVELLQAAVVAQPTIGYSHLQLGLAYERGMGVAADKTLAAESYRKALANGATSARDRLKALGFSE